MKNKNTYKDINRFEKKYYVPTYGNVRILTL